MRLESGRNLVVVSPEGGSILQWQVDERFVLGPTREMRIGNDLKWRGVTHWCLPNFGTPPDAYAHLGQHGWLRWTMLPELHGERNDRGLRTSVDMKLRDEEAIVEVGISVTPRGVGHTLSFTNLGGERVPILPGLHPYFAMPPLGLYRVRINGETIAAAGGALAIGPGARILERTGEVAVELDGLGAVTLGLEDACTHLVLWSDDPKSYVCVEPVFGKPRTFGSPESRWLEPGEAFRAEVKLDFTPA